MDVIHEQSGKSGNYDISGDVSDSLPIPFSYLPIVTTVTKIEEVLVLDCNGQESQCATASLAVAIDGQGECCGLIKMGNGSTTILDIRDSLEVSRFLNMLSS